MRFYITFLFAVAISLTITSSTLAQEAKERSSQERPLIEQVRDLDMDSLQREGVTVHFTPGYQNRAERLGTSIVRELQLFRDSLGTEFKTFHLILPDTTHWAQLAEVNPYGVPKSLGAWQRDNLGAEVAESVPLQPPSALVPADAKGAVFEQLLTLEECIASRYRERLREIDLSWENASRRYVEAITFHEVAHLITDTDAYTIGMPTGWFREFLANVFGYAYMYNSEPKLAKVWNLMTAGTLECYTPTHGRTLAEARILSQSADDYHWLQSFLIQRANQVVENHGFNFLRKAQGAFLPRSSNSPDPIWEDVKDLENEWERLSEEQALRRVEEINQEMLSRLELIAPGFQSWAQRFQSVEGDGD